MSGSVYKNPKMKSTMADTAGESLKSVGNTTGTNIGSNKVTVNDLDKELSDKYYGLNSDYLTDNPDFYVGDLDINIDGSDTDTLSAIIAALNSLYARLAALEGEGNGAVLSYFPMPHPSAPYARDEYYDSPVMFNFSNNEVVPGLGWHGHIIRLKQRQRSLLVARYCIKGTLPANNGEGYSCANPMGFTFECKDVTGMSGNINVGPIDPVLIVNHADTKTDTQGSFNYRQYTVSGPPDDVEVTLDYMPTAYQSLPTWEKGQFVPRVINKTSSDINLNGREIMITLIGSGDNLADWDSTSLTTFYEDENGYYWGHVHNSGMSQADGCLITKGAGWYASGDIS